jgi:hypothetical protein
MSKRRVHGPAAAGAGQLDDFVEGAVVGPCPSCGTELRVGAALNPATSHVERILLHPIPFCTYYGESSPDDIVRAIEERRS